MKHGLIQIAAAGFAISAAVFPQHFWAQPPAGGAPSAGQAQGGPGGGGRGNGMPRGPVMTTDFNDHEGFKEIFDGKSLSGWDGAPEVWRVEDGAIVGESTTAKPTGTTFIIYRGGEPADFDMKFEFKIEGTGGNSGIQYRSRQELPMAFTPRPAGAAGGPGGAPGAGGPGGPGGGPGGQGAPGAAGGPGAQAAGPGGPNAAPGGPGGPGGGQGRPGGGRGPGFMSVTTYQKWNVKGYQDDQGYDGRSNGNLWEGGRFAGERGTVASIGQAVELREGLPNVLLATLETPDEAVSWWKKGDWNQEEIIARGNVLTHIINGHVITITYDDNAAKRVTKGGVIAFQIEAGGDFKVSARNIWLKTIQ